VLLNFNQIGVLYKGIMYSPMHLWTEKALRKARAKAKADGEKLNLSPTTLLDRCGVYYLLRTDPEYMNKEMKDIKDKFTKMRDKRGKIEVGGVTHYNLAIRAFKEWKEHSRPV